MNLQNQRLEEVMKHRQKLGPKIDELSAFITKESRDPQEAIRLLYVLTSGIALKLSRSNEELTGIAENIKIAIQEVRVLEMATEANRKAVEALGKPPGYG